MSAIQQTIFEIDLGAVTHNFQFLRSKINEKTKFLAVVKANSYGSDAVVIAKHLQELGVDYFAVAYAEEGIELRDAGIHLPILVLHPQVANFKTIIERCLEPNLYAERVFNSFLEVAFAEGQTDYPIHIKFNTGLNRLGFEEKDIDFLAEKLQKSPQVYVKSIFSHLAASEDASEKEFTLQQINRFNTISKQFEDKIGYEPIKHQLNTSGVLNYANEAQFDMVRSGIGLYGFGNDAAFTSKLKNVFSLKSVISQIHEIEQGESVGYNRAFTSTSEAKIKTATIPIGHADGVYRSFGNGKGFVTIHGKKAYTIGNVCMDMIMVNVTDIDCKEGDEVVVFNSQNTVNELAKNTNTISYEIITAISKRIKRVVK